MARKQIILLIFDPEKAEVAYTIYALYLLAREDPEYQSLK